MYSRFTPLQASHLGGPQYLYAESVP